MTNVTLADSADTIQKYVDELWWYHTIDVAPGVRTPGWFDLRHALDLIPFPDLTGKRCLDIGTWDGFYAFEMEKRGAAEVVAVDIEDLADIDYPPAVRADTTFDHSQKSNLPRQAGFERLHKLFESKVEFRYANIYDLDPDELGTFDFVVVGSLLVHLRDPVRALDAVRKVTGGQFLLADYIHPAVNVRARKKPMFELRGQTADFQWWLASDAGLRQLLDVGGFEIEEVSDRFLLRPGPIGGTTAADRGRRGLLKHTYNRLVAKDGTPGGHLHRAYLSRPRF